MKRYFAIFGILFSLVFLSATASSANAQFSSLSGDQLNTIRANCSSAKDTLNQLHTNDALLRVNRGQVYESLLTKLMQRFNSRLSNNSLTNATLVGYTTEYEQTLKTFREDYIRYEEALTKLTKVDCTNQPQEFYDEVLKVRALRQTVNAQAVKLNQLIDSYTSEFYIIKSSILASLQGGGNK